jgi:predicted lipoprotein with Yx(FWY)xxD motif
MIKTFLFIVACAMPIASLAEAPKIMHGMLVDEDGKTLYTFDKDTVPGKSACTGNCATTWPAAAADSYDKASGDWSLVSTADGKRQWAYKGHPLYRYAADKNPGDTKGDGFKGMWHAAKPGSDSGGGY